MALNGANQNKQRTDGYIGGHLKRTLFNPL
jgi:hypothetical protein